jgi:hypothetical protein
MAEEQDIFSSKIKHDGVFSFKDLYKFCYDWLTEETGLSVSENEYSEKISGDAKNIEVKWTGTKKVTDYFKFKVSVKFRVIGLKNIEAIQEGTKINTNKGSIEISIKGTLIRDYQGKFEKSSTQKFMRSIYEKWVIPSSIDQFEGDLAGKCDTFLGQAKSWLDLEGKK